MALDFAAGCLGGCAGLMVGYPLDTIKVHIQTQDHRNPKFNGTWHCFRTILARESTAGLYRGITSPIAGVALVNAIIFGAYGQAQRHLPHRDDLSTHFLSGAMAGLAQAPICSPLELAKTRLQLQNNAGERFTGPIDCLMRIYRRNGHRGVFNGLGITAVREAPSFGIYFTTYEALTRSSASTEITTVHMLIAGGLAGTASWTMTYPVDVIKSRLQADSTGRYNGAIDCLRQSISSDGYKWLFRGLNSTIIRAFPTNAATFAVVNWTFRIFTRENHRVAPSSGLEGTNAKQGIDDHVGKTVELRIRERDEPLRVTFFDKLNSLMNRFVNDYNYETGFYCSMSLALIAGEVGTKRGIVDDDEDRESDDVEANCETENRKIEDVHR